MDERRAEARMWCADLVEVRWHDKDGLLRKAMANLEDISGKGACLQMDKPVPHGAAVQISVPNCELEGKVRYCVYRDFGYFLGVQFEEGARWSRRRYRPQHMLDPRQLVARTLKRKPA